MFEGPEDAGQEAVAHDLAATANQGQVLIDEGKRRIKGEPTCPEVLRNARDRPGLPGGGMAQPGRRGKLASVEDFTCMSGR